MATEFKKTSENVTASTQHEAKSGSFVYNITTNRVNAEVESVHCSVSRATTEELPNAEGGSTTGEKLTPIGSLGLFNGNKTMSFATGEAAQVHVGVFEEFLGTLTQ